LRPWLTCLDCGGIFRVGKAYATEGRCRSCRLTRLRTGGSSYKGVKDRLRRELFEREEGVCQDCGEPVGGSFHAHHDVPQAIGGSNDLENLRLLCEDCHQGDGWYRNHWELVWAGRVAPR
jgi:5-methylcytosine-specific restriction endonuclease McrA